MILPYAFGSRTMRLAAALVGELVAPSRCAACDERVRPRNLFCSSCAATVERAPDRADRLEGTNGCLAAFEYGGAIATAIARLKYEDRADLAGRLGPMMLDAAERARGLVDVVVPVPLHRRGLAARGYNQAALLGAPVAAALGVAFAPGALARVRDTPRQASLDREDRLVNLTRAFEARGPLRVLSGKRVLLIDDVRTTGATLRSCAAALHEVNAGGVSALVLARRA